MNIPNHEYKKIYNRLLNDRHNIMNLNKKLLNEGKKEEYFNNCNILKGMTRVIEKLPRP